ncbi:uncharacterized protein EV154DRAFT_457862 [Mucor mucedo]|uniref:uncharacterized protein n=1 Tax=Mucor mucedo TaxID=29922 RepID=UPI00221F3B40|nr:uncharacterized protein EV154DRAFT_457862 [Mucor mucedo]KAI7895331.1 hypothetical protein EV154DRAFT_457862 [Mucor mucedo]
MTIDNPHAETIRKALDLLKEYTSNLDGWNLTQEKNGVKLYTKSDGSAFPIVRGETVLTGTSFTAGQVAAVATSPGCRKVWDEKFDVAELKQVYSPNEILFWSKVKTPWPISPRDMVGVSLRENPSDDIAYSVMSSVKDASLPDVSGCVRSHLFISGWKLQKTDAGVAISYITQIDLAGSIPAAFLKSTQQQIPLCAGSVAKFIKENGFPPIQQNCTAQLVNETFDYGKREHVTHFDGQGSTQFFISSQMYPKGVKVTLTGNGSYAFEEDYVRVTGIDGPTTISIKRA